ncbi:MAG: hypothetical protein ABIN67_07025 [Ferruginibacter sp.]
MLCFFPGMMVKARQSPQHPVAIGFDVATFYAAFSKNDTDQLNALLTELNETSVPAKEAYEGALLMKKAGLLSKAKEKLKLFKSGREKLEAAIKKDPDNYEYRFLRLIIQENVPKIVRYKSNIKEDGALIRSSYKKLPPIVQQAIRDYSKTSKILNPADF